MPLEARLLFGLAIAVAVVHLTTPLAIRVAERFEFYDHPVGYKGHASPTPYLGGAAVVAGFLAAIALLAGSWDKTLPLVCGVLVLWLVGTVDDRRTLPPLTRVVVEVGLGLWLWALGLGWSLGLGDGIDAVASALWIVAVVNAFNLFDNMDGAASSMAAVVAAGLAVLGVAENDTWLTVTAAALCGASAGFLPHNLFATPARIFLGDGGSLPLGFAVAAVAMIGVSGAAAAPWQSLAIGLLFVGIPALDTALVTISRRRRGISILTGGRDHLTHRTRQRLRTTRAVSVTLGGAQAIISALAVVALREGSAEVVVVVVAYLVGLGVAITLLDARFEPVPATAEGATVTGSTIPAGPRTERTAALILVALALAIAASPFAFGYYDATVWVPAGLALLGVATAGLIARPPRLSGPATLLLGAVSALGIWALLSSLWSESVQQAVVEGDRWLMYAALLTVLLVFVRSERALHVLLAALAAGMAAVGVVVLVRMLGHDAPELFLGGRLNEPLGYINGLAAFMLLGAWLCLWVSEQRNPVIAGAGAAGATLLGGLAMLSQSRGVVLAAAVSVVIVLVVMPGRVRRGWALVVVGAGIATAAPALLDLFDAASASGGLSAGVVNDAAIRLAAGALLAGALWAVALWVLRGVPASVSLDRVGAATLAVGLVVALGIGLASANRLADTLHRQYDAFVHLSIEPQGTGAPVTTTRLLSGAGNRYDYWRVAWDAWRSEPLTGVGAGNYDVPYFRERTTTEDIRQPHSIELQLAGELGLVGAALLLLALAGIGWGAARARSAGGAVAACLGVVTAWLVHTSVDWIHLLPGVTAVALVAAAGLVGPWRRPAEAPGPSGRGRTLAIVVAAALVVVTAVSLTRQALSDRFESRARAALAADPAQALREADRALRIDPDAIGAYYVKSAALARFNEPAAARVALEAALRRDPSEFVTWALLGDLAVRVGHLHEARSRYEHAHALNPLDPSLEALAADPRSALSEP